MNYSKRSKDTQYLLGQMGVTNKRVGENGGIYIFPPMLEPSTALCTTKTHRMTPRHNATCHGEGTDARNNGRLAGVVDIVVSAACADNTPAAAPQLRTAPGIGGT